MSPNCNPDKSRLCGKACVSIKKNCRIGTARNRDPTKRNCNPQKSRQCGKACVSLKKECRTNPDGSKIKRTVTPKRRGGQAQNQHFAHIPDASSAEWNAIRRAVEKSTKKCRERGLNVSDPACKDLYNKELEREVLRMPDRDPEPDVVHSHDEHEHHGVYTRGGRQYGIL